MQLSRALRDYARTIPGKAQLFINSYAKALEVIPRQLCDNAGFDATDVLNKLRQKHALADGSGKVRGLTPRLQRLAVGRLMLQVAMYSGRSFWSTPKGLLAGVGQYLSWSRRGASI